MLPILLSSLGNVSSDDLNLLQHRIITHNAHNFPLLSAGAQDKPTLVTDTALVELGPGARR